MSSRTVSILATVLLLGLAGGSVSTAWAQSPPVPATTIKNANGETIFQLNTVGQLTLPLANAPSTKLDWNPVKGSFAAGLGSQANGRGSAALNSATTATGEDATALGQFTTAQSIWSLVIGRYNTIEGDPQRFFADDPLFVAGNGSTEAQRSNALLLRKNGNLTIAGTLTESSDARLKTDVEPLGAVLEDLAGLRPVRFRFKEGLGHPADMQIGLFAQEVQAAFPELVTENNEGYLSLAYPKLTAVLLKGLQEQQAQIDTLERHIAGLEDGSSAWAGWVVPGAVGGLLLVGMVGGWGMARRRRE